MRFSDTFKIKVLEERGEVRISVRTNDDRIDEFYIPIDDFTQVIEWTPSNVKFTNSSLWIKGIEKIALGIKTGGTQWCIYIFNPHNWSILREEFISQLRDKNINSIQIIGRGQSTPSQINSICNFDFSSSIDTLVKRVEILERSVNSLIGNQGLISNQISQLSQLTLVQPQTQVFEDSFDADMETESEEEFEDFETSTFIPTVEATQESESIQIENNTNDSDLLSTVERLKQLRKKRKK